MERVRELLSFRPAVVGLGGTLSGNSRRSSEEQQRPRQDIAEILPLTTSFLTTSSPSPIPASAQAAQKAQHAESLLKRIDALLTTHHSTATSLRSSLSSLPTLHASLTAAESRAAEVTKQLVELESVIATAQMEEDARRGDEERIRVETEEREYEMRKRMEMERKRRELDEKLREFRKERAEVISDVGVGGVAAAREREMRKRAEKGIREIEVATAGADELDGFFSDEEPSRNRNDLDNTVGTVDPPSQPPPRIVSPKPAGAARESLQALMGGMSMGTIPKTKAKAERMGKVSGIGKAAPTVAAAPVQGRGRKNMTIIEDEEAPDEEELRAFYS